MEADRDKEAFELNRKMDQDYWDSERKRLSLAKQKKSEMSDFLSKQIDERKNMKSKHDQYEIDFNKRYLESINTVKGHLQGEIKTKEKDVVLKTSGKKVIPGPGAESIGLVSNSPQRVEDETSNGGSRLQSLNF